MKNEFLRHTIATIKYRFDKSVINSEEDFGRFNLGKGSRNSNEIINHMYHVLNSTRIFLEEERFITEQPEKLTLSQEIERFNDELVNTDNALDVKELPVNYAKKLLQGPFSDILTHIGQISMMQRLNDKPINAEDFSTASIKTGMN
ncbi:MAG: hypothetical protein HRT58_19630 [Crocinitomicaceae bacterium]|nr:hypothetical protein [Flavobacteriales bacterium]NQZ37881.1 hypothetical protein [Crocinitomicaceae bacterium]